jgi:hypothetical protein
MNPILIDVIYSIISSFMSAFILDKKILAKNYLVLLIQKYMRS